MWGTNPLLLQEKHLSSKIPPCCELEQLGWSFVEDCLCFSYPGQCSPFILCYKEQFILFSDLFSQGYDAYVAVDFFLRFYF